MLLLAGGWLHGRGLSDWAAGWGIALTPFAAGLVGAAAAGVMLQAGSYLLWLPLSWRVSVRREKLARAMAASFGIALLLSAALSGSLGPVGAAALGLGLGAAGSLTLLGLSVGVHLAYALAAAGALVAAGFYVPVWLFDRLGPTLGLAATAPCAAMAAVLLAALAWPPAKFAARVGPALLPGVLALAAGTAWHGFLRPLALYRAAGLSPRAIVGVDGAGGCFARNRTGDLFYAGAGGSWERVSLPPGLRLGRVSKVPGGVLALEIRPEGDRLWRVTRGTADAVAVGAPSRETVFVADYALDGESTVAVDALGARLVWIASDGEVTRSEYPPVEAGAPLLVAAGDGALHVYTESGALLRLSSRGGWSVLRVPPPPGRPMSLSAEGGRYVLLARGARNSAALYELSGGVAGRWKALGVEGRWPRLATDGTRSFALEGSSVRAEPLAGSVGRSSALGPSQAAARAFDRTPAGALLRMVE